MILEISDLSKEFDNNGTKIKAVDNVSLNIASEDFVSIIGRSGSGKSTLFHLITGMLKPTTGKILIDDITINEAGEQNLSQLRNKNIGYILQEQNLLKNFTVLENVCLPNHIGYVKERYVYEKAEKILEEVGLLHLKDSFTNEISGGEARRVAIARALINDPSIIIADEPTSNLDPDNSKTIMQLFKKISESGVAVLISTHDMEFLKYSDKVFSMNNGSLESM